MSMTNGTTSSLSSPLNAMISPSSTIRYIYKIVIPSVYTTAMKAYLSSSSSSMYITDDMKGPEASQKHQSLLHSVRKESVKPRKMPIAPMPPSRPKVYQVEARDFRDLVQKLTGAPETKSRRLGRAAPAALTAVGAAAKDPWFAMDIAAKRPLSSVYQDFLLEISDTNSQNAPESAVPLVPLGSNLPVSPQTWYSFPLLSPGTLSSLEQSRVL